MTKAERRKQRKLTRTAGQRLTGELAILEANQHRDDTNPVDMSADAWAEFYGNCRKRTGMDFEQYMDHDMSMNY